MAPEGRTRTRRSLLRVCGVTLSAGLAGQLLRSSRPGDNTSSRDATSRRDDVGLVVYNADHRVHEVDVEVTAEDTTPLADRRSLPPEDVAAFRDAIPVTDDAVEYTLTVRLESGAVARTSVVVDALQTVREYHAVVHDDDSVSLSAVTA